MLKTISKLGVMLTKEQQKQIHGGYGYNEPICDGDCEWTEVCGCVCIYQDVDASCYDY